MTPQRKHENERDVTSRGCKNAHMLPPHMEQKSSVGGVKDTFLVEAHLSAVISTLTERNFVVRGMEHTSKPVIQSCYHV